MLFLLAIILPSTYSAVVGVNPWQRNNFNAAQGNTQTGNNGNRGSNQPQTLQNTATSFTFKSVGDIVDLSETQFLGAFREIQTYSTYSVWQNIGTDSQVMVYPQDFNDTAYASKLYLARKNSEVVVNAFAFAYNGFNPNKPFVMRGKRKFIAIQVMLSSKR